MTVIATAGCGGGTVAEEMALVCLLLRMIWSCFSLHTKSIEQILLHLVAIWFPGYISFGNEAECRCYE